MRFKSITLIVFFCLFIFHSDAQVIWSENFNGATHGFSLTTVRTINGHTSKPASNKSNHFSVDTIYKGGCGYSFWGVCIRNIADTPGEDALITGAPKSKYLHLVGDAYASENPPAFNACINPAGDDRNQPRDEELYYFAEMTNDISTVGKTNVELSFWWLNVGSNENYAQLYYSIDGGSNWVLAKDKMYGQSTWKKETYPASPGVFDNQPKLRIGFWFVSVSKYNTVDAKALQPSLAVDDIVINGGGTPPSTTVTTGAITGSPFCAGGTVSVPFTTTGTFNGGNTFSVYLSDANGVFQPGNGTLIGSGAASPVTATLPAGATAGSGYRIRVVASNPATTGSDNGVNLTINASGVAGISISANPSGTVCTGSTVNFTAAPANGGSSPSYQWKVNGSNIGPNSSVFTSSTLTNGDVVTCVMTSNNACATGSPATSNTITMNMTTSSPATVTVNPSATTICSGETVNFTATTSNGGSSPVYQWKVNSGNVGSNSPTYSSTTLNDGDVITCTLTSNSACVSGSPTVTSTQITITVGSSGNAGTISAVNDTICETTPAMLSVTGASGNIQWQSSSSASGPFTDVSGETNSSYIAIPTQTTYYKVKAGSGSCAATSATPYPVVVLPSPNAGFTYTISGNTVNFTNTSTGANAYLWNFGDGESSADVNPSHTYASLSNWHVCLDAKNGSNCSFTTCIDVLMTGIRSVTAQNQWEIFPNPVTDNLTIRATSGNLNIESVEVIDLIGKIVAEQLIKNQNKTVQINVAGLASGMYFLKIKTGDSMYVQQVVKQ